MLATGVVSLGSTAMAEEGPISTLVSGTTIGGAVDTSGQWKTGSGDTMANRFINTAPDHYNGINLEFFEFRLVREALIEFIDSDDSHPHWRDNMSKLDRRERESLAPMLLTIALGRAVERRDFQRVRTLLECSLKFGLVTHPAPRQAAGLLRRLAATSAAGSAWQ